VIATPEGFQTRRIIELARTLRPGINTAVRTHSEGEIAHLERRQSVGVAIMGERELAFGLMDYALQRLGTSADQARSVAQGMRVPGNGGVYERRPDRSAPELRSHQAQSTRPAVAQSLCLQRNTGAMGCALNMQLHRASRGRGIS
jgi:monovalent cation:H+ antiporter-2, CPA2 family